MSYNTDLQAKNARIQALIDMANALPDAGSGVILPFSKMELVTVTPTDYSDYVKVYHTLGEVNVNFAITIHDVESISTITKKSLIYGMASMTAMKKIRNADGMAVLCRVLGDSSETIEIPTTIAMSTDNQSDWFIIPGSLAPVTYDVLIYV